MAAAWRQFIHLSLLPSSSAAAGNPPENQARAPVDSPNTRRAGGQMLGTVAELGNPLLHFGVFVTDKPRNVAAPALASAAFLMLLLQLYLMLLCCRQL